MKKHVAVFSLLSFVLALSLIAGLAAPASAEVFISVRFGPPAIPVYAQPLCPGPGYFWVPGYWAWSDDYGYYWVPGTWVVAPVGMLWTPGYWAWNEGFYYWHPGYWGPHVGFYGGIDYGYGYPGMGFYGGEWRGRDFYYNRSVTNVNIVNVTNVYNKTVIVNNTTVNRVSYNGGPGGIAVRPTTRELAVEREPHRFALPAQTQHEHLASRDRQLFASENHGRPAIAATMKPAVFTGRDVVAARAAGAAYRAPAMSPREARGPATNGNRPGSVSNARSNDGFQKFGQPANNNRAGSNGNWNNNVARPGNANSRGNSNWNNNAARPGNQANSNGGYQKFGQPNNGNRNMTNNNENWRQNRPNGNNGRQNGNVSSDNRQSGGKGNQAQPWRANNQSQAQQHRASQQRETTPKTVNPHPQNERPAPRENPGREGERGPGRGR